MGQSNHPKKVVALNRILTDYIAPGKITYVKQEPDDAGVEFSETDRDNDWKNNFSCHRCGFKVHQLKECNKTLPEDKNKIYAMKKAGTFEANKTGVVNDLAKVTPGDNYSAALSVIISGSEHD